MKKISLLLLLICVKQVNAQLCFGPMTSFTTGLNPNSITNADFNGDGKLDLATANFSSNNITVLLGTGIGNFISPSVNFTVGTSPNCVINADFNGDGNKDLAISNQGSNSVSILLGLGNGGFSSATNFTVGTAPYSLCSADFNGDTLADLAVANKMSNNVSILLGTGTGTFGAATTYSVGSNPFSVISVDFNNDGFKDLAVARPGNVSVLLGAGTGTFGTATNFPVTASSGISITSEDFNGDGFKDLATAFSILLGTGTGSFGTATSYGMGGYGVASADFNGDGKIDLVEVDNGNSSNANAWVSLGTGTGAFGAAIRQRVGSNPISVTVGDFNGDGKADFATANYGENDVSVMLGSGTGNFSVINSVGIYTIPAKPVSVCSADFNGDGKADLAISDEGSTSNNSLSVLLGTGTGSYGPVTNISLVGGGYGNTVSVVSADFNGDGKTDLALADVGPPLYILLGTGTGSFNAPITYTISNTWSGEVINSDFNGDTKIDLAISEAGSNRVFLLLGNGTGNFALTDSFAVGKLPYSICSADFNGDGKADIASANYYPSHNVSILLNTGSGSFALADSFAVDSFPYSICSADFNGDGKIDLATASGGTNNISILLGIGNGSFSPATYFAPNGCTNIITTDINGDGKADLVATNANKVSILLGTGTGSFSAPIDFQAGANPSGIASADINGDGKVDIVTANFNSSDITPLINCTPTPTCVASVSDSLFNISPLNWGLLPHYSSQVISAVWHWGDGTTSTGLYPSHTYTAAGWYSICATVYTSCGDSASTCRNDTLYKMANNNSMINVNIVSTTTGVNQLSKNNQLTIYPNPTSDQFFIDANTTDKLTVDMFDVNGRHVFSANVMDKSNINVTALDNGAYTLTIKTADRVINKKLVMLR